MRPWMLLILMACDSKAEKSAPIEQICTQVVECGTYGWTSQSECESGWIDNPDYGTECAYDSQYLDCAMDCLEYGCDEFEDCESYCWVGYCL